MRVKILFEEGTGGILCYAEGDLERTSDREVSLSNVTVTAVEGIFTNAFEYDESEVLPDLAIGQPFVIWTKALPA